MSKLTSSFTLRWFSHIAGLIVLASLPVSSFHRVQGQSKEKTPVPVNTAASVVTGTGARREVLPPSLGTAWRAAGPAQQISAEKFAPEPKQDAKVYLEYGLQSVIRRTYANGQKRVTVEAYEMRHPSEAYGLFTFNRGSLPAGCQEIQTGRYVVRVSGLNAASNADPGFVGTIQNHLSEGSVELPKLPDHLPEEKKIAGSEKYLVGPAALSQLKPFSDLKDVISFTGGAEAMTAEYENGSGRISLLIVDCYTPQLAVENFTRLRNHLDSLSPEEKNSRLIKRPGNYIVEAVNVTDPVSAQALLNQIKYAQRVYWEGDRFTSIPFEYRPPDPLMIEEIRRTGAFLASSFFMIGLMIAASVLTGIIAGGAFFYWRNYRRRKPGLGNAFSDAGGTIRLNLDGYLIPTEKSQVKLLEK